MWAKNVQALDEAITLMTPQWHWIFQSPCPSCQHPKCRLSPIPTLQNNATPQQWHQAIQSLCPSRQHPKCCLSPIPTLSLGPSCQCLAAHQAPACLSPIWNQQNNASQSLSPSCWDPMQVESDNSDQTIDQISQEIQTLERITNRLNHLYSLCDKLVCRGDSNLCSLQPILAWCDYLDAWRHLYIPILWVYCRWTVWLDL